MKSPTRSLGPSETETGAEEFLRNSARATAGWLGLTVLFSAIAFWARPWLQESAFTGGISGVSPATRESAVLAIFIGLSIIFRSRKVESAAVVCAGIGLLGAVVSITGRSAGIRFLFSGPASVPLMAALGSEALAMLWWHPAGILKTVLRYGVGVSGIVSIILILSQASGGPTAGQLLTSLPVDIVSTLWIAVIALAFILLTSECGIGAVIVSPLNGGHMARRILPLVILVPIVFRFIRFANESTRLIQPDYLALGLSGAFIILMSSVVLLSANRLNDLDGYRRQVADRNATIASIVDSSPDAILSVDLAGNILSWNAGAVELYGYSHSEAMGQKVAMLAPPDRVSELAAIFERVTKGDLVENIETVRQRKDGSLFEANVTVAPIRHESGEIGGFSAIVRDLTKVRDYERRFRSVVESAPIAMIVVDGRGNIVLINRLTRSLFGYTQAELVGDSVEKLIPVRFSSQHGQLRDGYFERPEVRQMGVGRDLYALRKDGSEFPVEIGLNPLVTPEGTLTLAAIADITERKRASQELEAHAQELKRSNAELEQFAYVASHDLQEPLRMVVSYMDLLQDRYKGSLDERADKYIGYAVDGSRRMQRLVQDLLTVSRVSSQAKPLAPTSADAVLDWVLRSLGESIRESNARVDRDKLPLVLADEVQLGQVFQNLISNAIKFRSDEDPHIQVRARRVGTKWRISVSDNGIGIEPEYHERIFQMFQRLHERDRYDGSGIGLSVSRKIIDRHGGELVVESVFGKGSTFSFTISAAEVRPFSRD